MKKRFCYVLMSIMVLCIISGCGNKKEAEVNEVEKTDNAGAIIVEQNDNVSVDISAGENSSDEDITENSTESEGISNEQALSAIMNYCYSENPDLKSIVEEGEYPVYWDISSSDEKEIVIAFRSYTGAIINYYIDRNSGDTYVTEFVPGIMDDEEKTDERFNVKNYF